MAGLGQETVSSVQRACVPGGSPEAETGNEASRPPSGPLYPSPGNFPTFLSLFIIPHPNSITYLTLNPTPPHPHPQTTITVPWRCRELRLHTSHLTRPSLLPFHCPDIPCAIYSRDMLLPGGPEVPPSPSQITWCVASDASTIADKHKLSAHGGALCQRSLALIS